MKTSLPTTPNNLLKPAKPPVDQTATKNAFDDLEETERTYKLRILLVVSRIAFWVVVAALVAQVIGWVWAGYGLDKIIGISLFILPFVLLGGVCNWLARQGRYVVSSWLLVINCLIFTMFGSFFSNTDVPIIAFYIIPITLVILLLGQREAIIVVAVSVAGILFLYFSQHVWYLYTPARSSEIGQLVTGLVVAIVLFPAFTALLFLPLQGILALNRTRNGRLKQTLSELESRQTTTQVVSRQVRGVVTSLHDNAQHQTNSSFIQVENVKQINYSVEELSNTAGHIEQLANQINHSAGLVASNNQLIEQTIIRSVTQSEAGLQAVENTTTASNEVGVLYQQLVTTMEELSRKSLNMRIILDILNSIAGETHLLSLNAAIEAAGAGEFGQRFSVIAQEVKNLAQRSSEANQQVIEIISEIESSTKEAVEVAQQGYTKTHQMGEVAGQTGEVIRQMRVLVTDSRQQANAIGESVKQMQELGSAIHTVTTQQRVASEQVQIALQELAEVADESVASSKLVSTSAATLAELSQDLNSTFGNS